MLGKPKATFDCPPAMSEDVNSTKDSEMCSGLSHIQPALLAPCIVCEDNIHHKACVISCAICAGPAHTACLTDLYKRSETGIAQPKNSQEWFKGFMVFSGLRYTCHACRANGNPHGPAKSGNSEQATDINNSTPPAAFINLRDEITAFGKRMDDMQAKLLNQMQQLIDASDNTTFSEDSHLQIRSAGTSSTSKSPSSRLDDKSNARKPPSYASVVSGDVNSVVKAVVYQTMKEEQWVSDKKATIVVYGFPEDGNDRSELHKMLDFIGCRCDIAQHTRIGRITDHSKSLYGRLIKVKLNSPREANLILSCAKYLRSEAYHAGVNLSKWLSLGELENVKQLREQCAQFNISNKENTKGRICFIVVSGQIMKRDAKGKLQYFKNSITQSSGEALGGAGPQTTTNNSSPTASTTAAKSTQPKNE